MVTLNQVTPITIPDLGTATTLSGNELLPISQANQAVNVAVSALPQGMTAGVITYGTSGGAPFPNYRTLSAGSGLHFTDGGAQGDLTISVTGTTSAPPASASSAGIAGTLTWDSNFFYICIASNTWKRVAISAW